MLQPGRVRAEIPMLPVPLRVRSIDSFVPALPSPNHRVVLIPVVHFCEGFIRLVDGNHRAFAENIEVFVGDDGGDFDNDIVETVQSSHFQINPD